MAERFVRLGQDATATSGRFTVALSGGSTPKGVYSLLAESGYKERIPWSKVHLFWGDDRCVPPDHPESNYRMVQESLLSKVAVPAENVHRLSGEKEPQLAAAEYEGMLKIFFRLPKGALPRFDLILLGLGEDGHTASLFPGSDALNERNRLVVAPYVQKLNVHRLTLTLPVLNQASNVIFLVAGKSKAVVLDHVLSNTANKEALPASRVKPRTGTLTWFVDEEASM